MRPLFALQDTPVCWVLCALETALLNTRLQHVSYLKSCSTIPVVLLTSVVASESDDRQETRNVLDLLIRSVAPVHRVRDQHLDVA